MAAKNIEKRKNKEAVERRAIRADDVYNMVSVEDPRISPDGQWIAYVRVTVDRMGNSYNRTIWLIAAAGGEPIQLTRSGKDSSPRWSPDGKTLAFASGRDKKSQIYLLTVFGIGAEPRPLTKQPNGANAFSWSADGKWIAFLTPMSAEERKNEHKTPAPPQDKLEAEQREARRDADEKKKFDPRVIERLPYREGTSYRDGRYNQIYVIATDDPEATPRRLTNLDVDYEPPKWSPDGKYLYSAHARDIEADEPWQTSTIYQIAVKDGKEKAMTGEGFRNFGPLPSPDGKWIAFYRSPVGFGGRVLTRLAVMPSKGGEPRDLNLELDRSLSGQYDWVGLALRFMLNNAGDVEVGEVEATGGPVKKWVTGVTVEGFSVNQAGDMALAVATSLGPAEIYAQTSGKKSPTQLTRLNQKWLDDVMVQPTQEIRYQSADGTEIHGWYILPVGYQKGQSYPLAHNVHGGPHIMWGPAEKAAWHEWQVQAARGYVVFYCNPRGSDGYGAAFRDGIFAAWGVNDYPDQMAGVDKLIEMGLVDETRMGISGGSYGGFMVATIAARTDRYAAVVGQRGVYSLLSQDGTSDFTTLGLNEIGVAPWDDPQKLWAMSPLAQAHKIKTPLLLIHSENDYRVAISEAEQMFVYVRRSGGTVKLLRFPRDGHEMTRSGEPEHRVQSIEAILEWFDRYCK